MRLGDLDALMHRFMDKPPDYYHTSYIVGEINIAPTVDGAPVVRCKDCKYYCVKDFWGDFHGVPILAASNVPTCNKWANTESKVDPDGFCFLAEKMDRGDEK